MQINGSMMFRKRSVLQAEAPSVLVLVLSKQPGALGSQKLALIRKGMEQSAAREAKPPKRTESKPSPCPAQSSSSRLSCCKIKHHASLRLPGLVPNILCSSLEGDLEMASYFLHSQNQKPTASHRSTSNQEIDFGEKNVNLRSSNHLTQESYLVLCSWLQTRDP